MEMRGKGHVVKTVNCVATAQRHQSQNIWYYQDLCNIVLSFLVSSCQYLLYNSYLLVKCCM